MDQRSCGEKFQPYLYYADKVQLFYSGRFYYESNSLKNLKIVLQLYII